MTDSKLLYLRMQSLTILSNLRQTDVFRAYSEALEALGESPGAFCRSYAALCRLHYRCGDPGRALTREIRCDSNALTRCLGGKIPSEIRAAADFDLYTINALISLSGKDFLGMARRAFPGEPGELFRALPGFSSGSPLPFGNCDGLCQLYLREGFGHFARANAFTVRGGRPCAIDSPDPIRLSDLKGYAVQKKQIIDNTLALLRGGHANNILLYGDRGCGKSSTVKAVCNEYAARGLKIVELPIQQLEYFPDICAQIQESPFSFVLFLDDLAFDAEDDRFATLKAFIEGGVADTPHNMVIYATSNRRHIVRERFSDREGDDVHARDARQNAASLSDRFGIEITFSNPVKNEYLSIVDQLAEDYGLSMPEDELHLLAERFATRRSGRSPRTARQFIKRQLAQQAYEEQP